MNAYEEANVVPGDKVQVLMEDGIIYICTVSKSSSSRDQERYVTVMIDEVKRPHKTAYGLSAGEYAHFFSRRITKLGKPLPVNNLNYCNCNNPTSKTVHMLYSSFSLCTQCNKEISNV